MYNVCILCYTCYVIHRYHGSWSLQTALTHHLIARVQSFLGDFRAALTHEKTTFSIYKKVETAAKDLL